MSSFGVWTTLFLLCTVTITIIGLIFETRRHKSQRIKPGQGKLLNPNANKQVEKRNGKKRSAVQNHRRMRENAKNSKNRAGSNISVLKTEQNEQSKD